MSWANMLQRCTNPKATQYSRYGGAGITVCAKWHDFDGFLEDMGERPEGLTLDRIDNAKGYFKENCQWASREQQQRNRNRTLRVPYKGDLVAITELSEKFGIDRDTLLNRIKKGWPEEEWDKRPRRRPRQ